MQKFLPIFVVNRSNHLQRLKELDSESFGILATFQESDNFLRKLRDLHKPYFIDSGVFEIPQDYSAYSSPHQVPWYWQVECYLRDNFWHRRLVLAQESRLRERIQDFLTRCDRFAPDYVLAPDVIHEPLLSLYLARLAREEYHHKKRHYQLIGVVQVGYSLYEDFPRITYTGMKQFVSSLIGEYRRLGYNYLALGGLLKADKSSNTTGLKFGLSNSEFDQLLSWTRPNFVLGGLALTRLPVLKKHQVWADSSGWIWWQDHYNGSRFVGRDVMAEVFAPVQERYSVII